MTEMHTKEPWRTCGAGMPGKPCPCFLICGEGDRVCIATWYGNDSGTIDGVGSVPRTLEGQANARRIVACVNACAGIPTEALEAGAVTEMRAVIAYGLGEREATSACKALAGYSTPDTDIVTRARKVLAQTKGEPC